MESARALTPTARLAVAAQRVVDAVSGRVVEDLPDRDLLDILGSAAEARDALDVVTAQLCAEIARRSSSERGHDGLAQRVGHANATSLIQHVAGASRPEVARSIRTGEELGARMPPGALGEPSPQPVEVWDDALRQALLDGRLGQGRYRAIRTGLGEPPVDRYPELDPDFLPTAWRSAAAVLVEEASEAPVEELRASARIARDRLDPVGVALRFEDRFRARSFRRWMDEAGQQHARIVFDDDAAAWVDTIMSAALRPRRAPRFVEAPPSSADHREE